jgi:Fur family transcriptional regulator, ferric uptake regulator
VHKASAGRAELKSLLRSVGLRATAPRLAVLARLVESHTAQTHGDIAAHLQPELDRATVYRNLMDLTNAGLVHRSDIGDHVWRFEWVGARGHVAGSHPHFICGSCGTVTCLPEDAVSVHVSRGAPRALKKRRGVTVQLRGLCDACT